MEEFKNKVAIVTGAGGGIGRATALMLADRGANVVVADVLEDQGRQTVVMIAENGLLGLTQVWCQELGEHNITVNAICPGFVESPMWADHLSPAYAPAFGVEPENLLQTVANVHMPMGRPQTPEEIGESVAYFCQADSTSGQALVVDGGHAMW